METAERKVPPPGGAPAPPGDAPSRGESDTRTV